VRGSGETRGVGPSRRNGVRPVADAVCPSRRQPETTRLEASGLLLHAVAARDAARRSEPATLTQGGDMRMKRGSPYATILATLLLTVSSASAGGAPNPGAPSNAAGYVTAVLTEKVALQDCDDPTKVKDYRPKGKFKEGDRWLVIQDPKRPAPEG